MCGRFALKTKPKKLAQSAKAKLALNLESLVLHYNIAPSSSVPVIRFQKNERVMEALKWGLVPYYFSSKRYSRVQRDSKAGHWAGFLMSNLQGLA